MTPGQELEEIACSFCVPHQGSGFHPGCIYCMRSYAAVKAGYERAVRNYDWVVIKSIRAERVGESPAPAKEAARILVEGLPFNLSAYKQGEIVKIMLKFCGGGQ